MSAAPLPHFPKQSDLSESANITLAQPRHVRDSDLSRTERQVWFVLCDHRNKGNVCFPRVETIAKECCISVRSVQRAIQELLRKGWICMPNGDAGGRGNATVYHLHADGHPCHRPKSEPKQQAAAARCRETSKKGDNVTPFPSEERVTNPTVKGDILTQKGDKSGSAYKEEPLDKNLSRETTTSPRAREDESKENDKAGGGELGSFSKEIAIRPSTQFSYTDLAEFERMEVLLFLAKQGRAARGAVLRGILLVS